VLKLLSMWDVRPPTPYYSAFRSLGSGRCCFYVRLAYINWKLVSKAGLEPTCSGPYHRPGRPTAPLSVTCSMLKLQVRIKLAIELATFICKSQVKIVSKVTCWLWVTRGISYPFGSQTFGQFLLPVVPFATNTKKALTFGLEPKLWV